MLLLTTGILDCRYGSTTVGKSHPDFEPFMARLHTAFFKQRQEDVERVRQYNLAQGLPPEPTKAQETKNIRNYIPRPKELEQEVWAAIREFE